MTNSKMFDEIGCPDKLKDCQFEVKRHKKHIKQLNNIIFSLEKEIEEKENEIKVLRNG
tara:strand:+ start:880 stop:1053 length:174 start_codon:yes stop_codon:yes gene_type:complete